MRRVVTLLISLVIMLSVVAGPAGARSLTVRTDPNDTRTQPDIRKVFTDLAGGRVFIQIRTWDHLRHPDARFAILLDTNGTNGFDRVIELSGGVCVVEEIDEGSLGLPVGSRPARFPGVRDAVCRMPAGWFAIDRTVRFVVQTGVVGEAHDDRAPDHGRFLGL